MTVKCKFKLLVDGEDLFRTRYSLRKGIMKAYYLESKGMNVEVVPDDAKYSHK